MDDVLALADDAAAADGVDPLDEATRLTLRHRPDSVRSVVDPEGFALLVGDQVSVVVRPSARSHGLGSRLLSRLLEQTSGPLVGWSHGSLPGAAALAAAHGFRPVRELWVMRRPSSLPLPVLSVPDDVTVRGFQPGDERSLLRVNAAAFAHHPEQGSLSAADLRERMAEPWFEPEGLIEAWSADGQMLGFHWTKRHSPALGEVYVVGISPAAQGRGLGKVLTALGLVHLSDVESVHLYVEATNTAAVRLYSGLGFTHEPADTHVQFARP
ncbi:mycothiol synthase [Nocardioides terrae]|uniref:Mycothiol acetyltransferase n=1 Tax=Nocardioides terrae TaxID=574651 RepID=A0A1I1ET22_9ACTN|nr:mycothiol synthase [Nocardioides terrae]SFB88060.1 mycothiol synthase [Nocardioides terrae]